MSHAASIATARWHGDTVNGSGTVSSASGALDARPLTWRARIGEEAGTTPEELLAAAHAGCYAMAFSFALSNAGHTPTVLDVEATCTFGAQVDGFGIHAMQLTVVADVRGMAEQQFQELALAAKDSCPVSRALAGIETTLDARMS